MACVCYGLRTTKLFRVIKVALRSDAQNASKDGKDEADPDPASAAIMPAEEETDDRNEKRGEQKFDRQVQRRGERDPDEPASAQVDEWHSRADPHPIISARDKCHAGKLLYNPGSVPCGSHDCPWFVAVVAVASYRLCKFLSCVVLKRYGTEFLAWTGGTTAGTRITTGITLRQCLHIALSPL
jgi:hypothetical protein